MFSHEQPSICTLRDLFNFVSSSDFFTPAEQAALHRATYTSALKGLIPWGAERGLAERKLGVTPVYLSNLLDPYHNPPSPKIAERIAHADVLAIDREQRLDLLEHMLLSRELQARSDRLIRNYAEQDIQATQGLLHEAYDAVLGARSSDTLGSHLLALRDSGQSILQYYDPRRAKLNFVEACLIVHYAQTALNRWIDALHIMNVADAVLQRIDPHDEDVDRNWYRHLEVNLLYARALTYRHLKLTKPALATIEQAIHLLDGSASLDRANWLPSLYRDKIMSLAQRPRFALADIEGLGDQIHRFVDQSGRDHSTLMLLLDRSLINAWMSYGSKRTLKRADALLRHRLSNLAQLDSYGPLPKTMFLRSAANYFWNQQAYNEWQYFAGILVHTARDAGLKHQLSEARREFGDAIDLL